MRDACLNAIATSIVVAFFLAFAFVSMIFLIVVIVVGLPIAIYEEHKGRAAYRYRARFYRGTPQVPRRPVEKPEKVNWLKEGF